jgi:hypothetical protein
MAQIKERPAPGIFGKGSASAKIDVRKTAARA